MTDKNVLDALIELKSAVTDLTSIVNSLMLESARVRPGDQRLTAVEKSLKEVGQAITTIRANGA